MKRGYLFLFLLLLNFSFVSSAIMHQSNDFMIKIDNSVGTLEHAIGGGYFLGTHTYSSVQALNPGHSAEEIWVSVQDGEMTLLQALQSTNKLCPNPSKPLTYISTSIPYPSHLATEIQLASGKNLQQSINDGDSCGCVPGATKSVDCSYLSNFCATYGNTTITCQPSGTWSALTCNPSSYWPRGSPCGDPIPGCKGIIMPGSPTCLYDNKACDGAGSCLGWSGTGCSGCPFGTDYQGTCPGSNSGCIVPAGYQSRYNWDDSWKSWIIPSDQYSPISHYPYCHGCNFCFAGLWCWSSESKSWQIKPV